jgi:hypothetical protein
MSDQIAQYGVETLTWPGSASNTNTATIDFASAFSTEVETLVLGAPFSSNGNFCFANYKDLTLSSFELQATAPYAEYPTDGETVTVSYLAIGY